MRLLVLTALVLITAARARGDLTLASYWPTGEQVCVDAPLRLTFNEAPVDGPGGKIEVVRANDGVVIETVQLGLPEYFDRFGANGGFMLRYEPMWSVGNTAHIRLRANCLAPGESYRVRVSRGCFRNEKGAEFAGIEEGWNFRTKPRMPRNPDRIVVAGDNSGDYCTIQGAVDQVEPYRDRPAEIFVRRGEYRELVRIGRERRQIHLVGEDRQETILSYRNNEKLNPGWIQRAVLGCEADDFVLEGLTVQNTTPYKGSQAEAVTLNAERCVLRNANFVSLQDTLNLSGRVYVADSYIEGDVDYVWGYGTAFFERCELRTMHDGYVVQARNSAARAGYIFSDCRLTAPVEVTKCWLARIETARFPASHVSFIRCAFGPHILAEGWQVTGQQTNELRFEEYASTDLEGKPLDLSRRNPPGRQLSPSEAGVESQAAILAGRDGWDPLAGVR